MIVLIALLGAGVVLTYTTYVYVDLRDFKRQTLDKL